MAGTFTQGAGDQRLVADECTACAKNIFILRPAIPAELNNEGHAIELVKGGSAERGERPQ